MRDNGLTRAKRRDLYAVYKRGLEEGRFTSIRSASEWISRQPAPCFYISPEAAYKYIGWVRARRSLMNFNASQRRMIRRLYSDYNKYLSDHPDTKRSCIDIMDELVQRPAPEFYMSPGSIKVVLLEEIAKVKKRWQE